MRSSPERRDRRSRGGTDRSPPYSRPQGNSAVAGSSFTAAPRVGRSNGHIRRDCVVAQARQHRQDHAPEPEVQASGPRHGRAIMSSRDRPYRTAARSSKQRWCAAWGKPLMPKSGRSSSAGSIPGSSGNSDVGAGRHTQPQCVRMEREIVGRMQEGNRRDYGDPMLVSPQARIATKDRHAELNASQRQAVDEIFLSRGEACRFRWHRRRGARQPL